MNREDAWIGFVIGFTVGAMVFPIIFALVTWRSSDLKDACAKTGYVELSSTTRIKCEVQEKEWRR